MFVMHNLRKCETAAIGLVRFLPVADGKQRDDFGIFRQAEFAAHSLRVEAFHRRGVQTVTTSITMRFASN